MMRTILYRTQKRALALAVSSLAASVMILSANALEKPPIPESSGEYKWSERQRIRFKNTSLIKDAHEAISTQDYDAAKILFGEILKNDPQNNHAKVYLVEVYDSLKEYDQGIALAGELTEAHPEYLDMYAYKGYMQLKKGDRDSAIQTLESLIQRADENYALRSDVEKNLAEQYFLKGELDKAKRYAEAVRDRDTSPAMNRLLAEIAIRQDENVEAGNLLEAAAATMTDPDEKADLKLKLAYVQYNEGSYEKAITTLNEIKPIFEGSSRQVEIDRLLAESFSKNGAFEDAVEAYGRILDQEFTEPIALAYLFALSDAGRNNQGVDVSRSYLDKEDISSDFQKDALKQLLYFQKNQNQMLDAFSTSQQLLQIEPSAENYAEAGDLAEKIGQLDEAVRLNSEWVSLDLSYESALAHHFTRKQLAEIREDISILEPSIPVLVEVMGLPDIETTKLHAMVYELAQSYRLTGNMDNYFLTMETLLKEQPNSEFAYEYAVQLYGDQRYEKAIEMFTLSLEDEANTERHYETSKILSDIYLVQENPDQAIEWLEKAKDYGDAESDRMWHLNFARAEYQKQQYQDVIRRLLPIAEDEGIFHMYIGFSFYRTYMPGLALLHLKKVDDLDSLAGNEKQALYANRAYLNFDQDQDEAAIKDAEQSLNYGLDEDMQLVKLKTLNRSGKLDEAIEYGKKLIEEDPNQALKEELLELLEEHPDPRFRAEMLEEIDAVANTAFLAEVYQMLGIVQFQNGMEADAVESLNQALKMDPNNVSSYYMRGLSYYRLGDFAEAEEDFLILYDQADSFPATFWGDMGILQGDLESYDLGVAALERSTSFYPYDIDTFEELGYQYQKYGDNRMAQKSFRQAMDIYDEILPYLAGEDFTEYREYIKMMKKENRKLDKIWGTQAYLQRTDYDFQTLNADEFAAADSIDGVLTSQAGIGITYRPPNIGFRDERELDFSLRILANLEPNSFNPDEESYQGGAGVLFKPLRKHSYRVGLERLFKIGENSERNWLWRNVYSWEHGESKPRYESVWLYNRLYGELSYYLEDVQRWVYYLSPRIGYSYTLHTDRAIMTFPELIGVARYQSNDPVGIGTYYYYGLGANIRLFGRETEYTMERFYIDLYAHYVLGRFSSLPEENQDDKYFDGFIIGVNFTK